MLGRELPPGLLDNLIQNDGTFTALYPPSTSMSSSPFNFPKVELHLHLDGSVRFSTLLELSLKKGIPLGHAKTVEEVKQLLVTHTPADLAKVLEAFNIFLPVILNDLEAIERIAYELCEDQAEHGVIYFEARYSPHLLIRDDKVTGLEVVEAVHRGLTRGEKEFEVHARQILCMINGLSAYDFKVLELVETCSHLGVVGIDVAGSAHGADEKYEPSVIEVFQEAAAKGIHRTAHAGESGGVKNVENALNDMHAERIGHGYRILRDEEFYINNFVNQRRAHLEACPYSSVMTGAVPLDWKRHPIGRWNADGVDFSLSRDDPTCFDNTPTSELQLAHDEIKLSLHDLWRAQLNGARAAFCDDTLKAEIVGKIEAAEPSE